MAAVPPVNTSVPPKEAPKPITTVSPHLQSLRDKLNKLIDLFPDRTYTVSYQEERDCPDRRYQAGGTNLRDF